MPLFRLLAIAVLCLIAAPPARADQAEISLPLDLYPLPQLARELSAEGRTVVCPSTFSQRVALIRLKKRRWEECRTALGEALGIRFRQLADRPGTWVMEPDPGVESLHDRWLVKLAELTVEAAKANAQEVAGLAALPYDAVLRETMRTDMARRALERSDPDAETEATQKAMSEAYDAGVLASYPMYHGARAALGLRAAEVLRAMKTRQRFVAVDTSRQRDSPVLQQFLEYVSNVMRQEVTDAPPEHQAAIESIVEQGISEIRMQWTGSMRLDFDAQTGTLRGQFVTIHPDRSEVTTVFAADAVEDRWPEMLSLLGKEAAEWLQNDDRRKAELLKATQAVVRVKTRGRARVSLSEWLESWASQTGAELAMELHPARETMPWSEVAGPGDNPPPASSMDTLSSCMSSDQPGGIWSVNRLDGIWIFTDRVAFVDRVREEPVAALIALDRKRGESERASNRADAWLYALRNFHRAVTPAVSAACGGIVSYRGLDLATVALARPAIQVLASLTHQDRARIRSDLTSGKAHDIPLATLPSSVLRDVAESMREMALSPRGYAVPNDSLLAAFPQRLTRFSLHLRPVEGSLEILNASFILTEPTARDAAVDLLEVEIPGLLSP
jgi:hypothetical protein